MANEKLSLSERQAIARRLAEERGISYKSALRSVQRYLTEAGQKRGRSGKGGIQQFRREEERIRPREVERPRVHHTERQADRLFDLGFDAGQTDQFIWEDQDAREECSESDECAETEWYPMGTLHDSSINGMIAVAESVLRGEDRRTMNKVSGECSAVIRIEIKWFPARLETRRGRGPRGERNVMVTEHAPPEWSIEVIWCGPKSGKDRKRRRR